MEKIAMPSSLLLSPSFNGVVSSAMNTKMESVEVLFTPCEAAKFHGEAMNMKQENTKAISELQLGQDQVKKLQAEIEDQLSKSCEKFEPFPPGSPHDHLDNPPRTRVPLLIFLFGAKPKKPLFLNAYNFCFRSNTRSLELDVIIREGGDGRVSDGKFQQRLLWLEFFFLLSYGDWNLFQPLQPWILPSSTIIPCSCVPTHSSIPCTCSSIPSTCASTRPVLLLLLLSFLWSITPRTWISCGGNFDGHHHDHHLWRSKEIKMFLMIHYISLKVQLSIKKFRKHKRIMFEGKFKKWK